MGLQLVFVLETNKQCNSDWIYIKDTIEHFYEYERTQVKFSPLYMNGKGNYRKKEKQVKQLVKLYDAMAKTNHSSVLYCFDCDDYDTKPDDRNFLEQAKQYCSDNGYTFIWFCKDIERVYIGKKVDDSQKKKEAELFKKRKHIDKVDKHSLSANNYQINTSNILTVLDQLPELSRKN